MDHLVERDLLQRLQAEQRGYATVPNDVLQVGNGRGGRVVEGLHGPREGRRRRPKYPTLRGEGRSQLKSIRRSPPLPRRRACEDTPNATRPGTPRHEGREDRANCQYERRHVDNTPSAQTRTARDLEPRLTWCYQTVAIHRPYGLHVRLRGSAANEGEGHRGQHLSPFTLVMHSLKTSAPYSMVGEEDSGKWGGGFCAVGRM